MAVHRLSSVAALMAASWLISFLSPAESLAQSKLLNAGDGPNKSTYTDMAVGQMVDALFAPNLSNRAPAKQARRQKNTRSRRAKSSRGALRGTLVNNPDTSDGSSEFALIDRYGGVLRYVEPVDDIDLEAHVGETVAVRHDTSDILLASQLKFSASSTADGGVQLAAYEEELIEPGLEEGSVIIPGSKDALYLDTGIDFGGCPHCGGATCSRRNGCSPGARGILYARVEYLLWWFDGMYIPPLVVEGDNNNGNFVNGVIVYGNQEILDNDRDGFRLRLGMWLDDCGQWAIEGDFIGFDEVSSTFTDGGDGVTPPFVGRPFIDATTGLDAVEDVSFPGINGFVTVVARSDFESAGLRLRHNICCVAGNCGCGGSVGCGGGVGNCGSGVGCGSGVCGGGRGTRRIDFLFGLRYANLEESLVITEDLKTMEVSVPQTDIFGQDRFFTNNEFIGGELGFLWEWECRRWSVEFLSLLAIGNNRQSVDISGFTTRNANLGAGIETKPGLLLTQTTNIGSYSRNEFSVIPQIGATAGFQLTPRFKVTGGYSLLYWGNVVRPGDQIDLHVNPALLTFPPAANPVPARPAFAFNETDFWAHGFNFGGEYRW